jgi:hypothetical protein
VDGGKARVILNVLVTSSEVSENRPMLDLLWSSVFPALARRTPPSHGRRQVRGTRQNVAALEEAGIRAYVAIPNFDFRDTGLFGPGHLRYDPEKDLYVCAANGRLCTGMRGPAAIEERSTGPRRKPATPASSKRRAPPASAGACCTERWRRTSTIGCALTAGLSPTRKPSERGGCG